MSGWIGVDLDGTLAEYTGSIGAVGKPVALMMNRVRRWISEGREVRIFTARACLPDQVDLVRQWLDQHGLGSLAITNVKDFGMVEMWDDRAIQVRMNTGERVGD